MKTDLGTFCSGGQPRATPEEVSRNFDEAQRNFEVGLADRIKARAGFDRRMALESAGFSPKARKFVLGGKPQDWFLAALERFLGDSEMWCCTLSGGPGSGKTTAACWAAQQYLQGVPDDHTAVMRGGYSAPLLVTAESLRNAPSFGFMVDGVLVNNFWRQVEASKFLVVDDIGAESSTDASMARLLGILQTRETKSRKTLITTNLDAADFSTTYQGRMESRLTALDGTAIWASSPDADFRKIKK